MIESFWSEQKPNNEEIYWMFWAEVDLVDLASCLTDGCAKT
jgi:hypothetical protein